MKTFEHENFYQILQIPANARSDEIKHAYRDALAIYEAESVATYSLFSEEQRECLLQAIERAFDTLINREKRTAYNQMLVDTGQMDAADFCRHGQRKLEAYGDNRIQTSEKRLSQWVQKKADAPEIRQLIEVILSKAELSGHELKQLREAYGIEIPEIHAVTKISGDSLKRIEANQFDDLPAEIYVKQFLKAYADVLHLDSGHVIDSYLKFMAQAKPNNDHA
ncbi:helix-turn-helix domain-containing protein [Desulfosarcina sp.]|uniref:helix-turn-helix domain-containing protein n=1 Tax=Desulfosarcina sp. TaxID=2027861 RepID=UPI003562E0CB